MNEHLIASSVDAPEVPELPVVGGRLGRNITYLAGGQAATWTVTLGWTFIVPRLLGAEGMGRLTAASSAAAILGVVLGLGTKTFLVREMVARPEDTDDLISAALALRLWSMPLLAGAAFAYGRLSGLDPRTVVVLYLATATVMFTLLAEPLQSCFQARERMHYLALSDVLDKTAQSFMGITVVLLGLGVLGIAVSSVAIEGLILLLNLHWIRRYRTARRRVPRRELQRMVRASLPYWSFGLFFMIYLWVDSVMLSLMAPADVVGWYAVDTKLFTTLMFLPAILATAWLPRLVTAHQSSPAELERVARRPIEAVLGLGLPVAVATAMVARPAIALLYGAQYRHAGPVLVLLAACVVPMYLNTMLNQVLVAAGRQRIWTWVMLAATVVNPALNWVLIRATQHRYANGALGAALSLLVTEVLIVSFGLVVVARRIVVRSSLWRLVRTAAAAAAMAGVMFLVRPFGFVTAGVAGFAVFFFAVWALRVPSPDEREAVGHVVRRALGALRRGRPAEPPSVTPR